MALLHKGYYGQSLPDVSNIAPNKPEIKGFMIRNLFWSSLQPTATTFDWSSLDSLVQICIDQNIDFLFMIQAGPQCPLWLFNTKGVPRVNTTGGVAGPTVFPYYLNANYKLYYKQFIEAVATHIAGWSAQRKTRCAGWQSIEGWSTNFGPYNGVPTNSTFVISATAWDDFLKEMRLHFYVTNNTMVSIFNPGDDGHLYDWQRANTPNAAVHSWALGKKFGQTAEDAVFTRTNPALFNRTELDGTFNSAFWNNQVYMALVASALNGNIHIFSVPGTVVNKEIMAFFNEQVDNVNAGFLYMRKQIDLADTTLYTVGVYGALIDPTKLTQYNTAVSDATALYSATAPNYLDYLLQTYKEIYLNPARATAIRNANMPRGAQWVPGDLYLHDYGVGLDVGAYGKGIGLSSLNQVNAGWRIGATTEIHGRHALTFAAGFNAIDINKTAALTLTGSVNIFISYFDGASGCWAPAWNTGSGVVQQPVINLANTQKWITKEYLGVTGLMPTGVGGSHMISLRRCGTTDVWFSLIRVVGSNTAPIANAGADKSITQPANSSSVSGSASFDPDGISLTYAWIQIGTSPSVAGIVSPAAVNSSITLLSQVGVYTFQLTVTDVSFNKASDQVSIEVKPGTPVANAGANQTVTLPAGSTVTLNGTGSVPVSGTITSYQWTKTAGVGGSFGSTANSAIATVTGLTAGSYTFALTVTNSYGLSHTDSIDVTVNAATNEPPVARIAAVEDITLPTNSVVLDASTSTAGAGETITAYLWTKVSGGTASINTNTAVSTTVTGLAAGSYTFQVQVTNNNNLTDTEIVTFTVHAVTPVQVPIADAGPSQTVNTSTVTLNADQTIANTGIIYNAVFPMNQYLAPDPLNAPFPKLSAAVDAITPTGFLNVMDYGAAGNGTTRDDNAIKACFDACPDGGGVIFPSGRTYLVSTIKVVTLNRNIKVWAYGATIKMDNLCRYSFLSLQSDQYGQSGTWTGSVIWLGGTLDGNRANQQWPGNPDHTGPFVEAHGTFLEMDSVAFAYAKDVTVINIIMDGISFRAVKLGIFANCTCTNAAPIRFAEHQEQGTAFKFTRVGMKTCYYFNVTATGGSIGVELSYPQSAGGVDPETLGVFNNCRFINQKQNSLHIEDCAQTFYYKTTVERDVTESFFQSFTVSNRSTHAILKDCTIRNVRLDFNQEQNLVLSIITGCTHTFEWADGATNREDQMVVGKLTVMASSNFIGKAVTRQVAGNGARKCTFRNFGPLAFKGHIVTNTTFDTGVRPGELLGSGTFNITPDCVYINVSNPVTRTTPAAANWKDTFASYVSVRNDSNVFLGYIKAGSDGPAFACTYAWTQIQGPAGAVIVSPNAMITNVTGLVGGSTYVFQVEATNSLGNKDTDTVTITTQGTTNQAPTANAGPNQPNVQIATGQTTATVNLPGSGSDPEGGPLTFLWARTAGAAVGSFGGTANQANATVTGLTAGPYTFQLTVTDNGGLTGTDSVDIVVKAPVTAPIANAGPPTLTITGSSASNVGGADTPGTFPIASRQWTVVSTPAGAAAPSFSTPTQATTDINNLTSVGDYTIRKRVCDNQATPLCATDTILITVQAASSVVTKFGMCITSTQLSVRQKVDAFVNLLNIKYCRGGSEAVREYKSKDGNNFVEAAIAAGLNIVFNINWNSNTGNVHFAPTDTNELDYKTRLQLIFDDYIYPNVRDSPGAINNRPPGWGFIECVVIENEPTNQNYFDDTAQNYLTELEWAWDVCHLPKYGGTPTSSYIKICDGMVPLATYAGMNNFPTGNLRSDVQVRGYRDMFNRGKKLDFITMHTNVNAKVNGATNVVQAHTNAKKHTLIQNVMVQEWHQEHPTDPQYSMDFVDDCVLAGIKYCIPIASSCPQEANHDTPVMCPANPPNKPNSPTVYNGVELTFLGIAFRDKFASFPK
jgi:hypothetical protein